MLTSNLSKTNSFATLFLVGCISHGFGQVKFPTNNETGKVEIVKVVQLDSTTKKDNFNKARLWVTNVFKSAKDVIQYENPDEGTIVCKGNIKVNSNGLGMNGTIHPKHAGVIHFSLEIGTKDDRSRIRITDIFHDAEYSGGNITNVKPDCGGMMMTIKTWNSIQQLALDELYQTVKISNPR